MKMGKGLLSTSLLVDLRQYLRKLGLDVLVVAVLAEPLEYHLGELVGLLLHLVQPLLAVRHLGQVVGQDAHKVPLDEHVAALHPQDPLQGDQGLDLGGPDILLLKHASSILRQSSNPHVVSP